MADISGFVRRFKAEELMITKKYYENPDFMIFYQCEGAPSKEILDYVKEVQLLLENKHEKEPRVLFTCDEKPMRNAINHFFCVLKEKVETERWWELAGPIEGAIWIKDTDLGVYSPEELVEDFFLSDKQIENLFDRYYKSQVNK